MTVASVASQNESYCDFREDNNFSKKIEALNGVVYFLLHFIIII